MAEWLNERIGGGAHAIRVLTVILIVPLLIAGCDRRGPAELLDQHAARWHELGVRWNEQTPVMVVRFFGGDIRWGHTFIHASQGRYLVSGEGVGGSPVHASTLADALGLISADEKEVTEWLRLLEQAELTAIHRLEPGVIAFGFSRLLDDGFLCVLEEAKLKKYRDAARTGTLTGEFKRFDHLRGNWFYYAD
jgi:hypothetical protein